MKHELSGRLRPDVEAAPWVIAAVRAMEQCITELTASLETASSTVIVLKQQQREGWAKLASGQEPLSREQLDKAFFDYYHKIKSEVSLDAWCAICEFILKRQAEHGIKEKP